MFCSQTAQDVGSWSAVADFEFTRASAVTVAQADPAVWTCLEDLTLLLDRGLSLVETESVAFLFVYLDHYYLKVTIICRYIFLRFCAVLRFAGIKFLLFSKV